MKGKFEGVFEVVRKEKGRATRGKLRNLANEKKSVFFCSIKYFFIRTSWQSFHLSVCFKIRK